MEVIVTRARELERSRSAHRQDVLFHFSSITQMQNLVQHLTRHFDAETADRFRLRWLAELGRRGVQWPRVVCDRLDDPIRREWTTECVDGIPQDRAFYERAILRVTGFDDASLRSLLRGRTTPRLPLSRLIHDHGLRRLAAGRPSVVTAPEHAFSSVAEMLARARAIYDEAMRRFRVRAFFDASWVPDLTIRCMTPREQANVGAAFYQDSVVALNPRIVTRESLGPVMYHEGVPGHHLQTHISARSRDLHLGAHLAPEEFRTSDAAFSEGWALYVERFWPGDSAYARSLRLRECRLVLDTGLHYYGWPRERATRWLHSQCPHLPLPSCEIEVDRYIALPAQALCYALGLLLFEHHLPPLGPAELLGCPQVQHLLLLGVLPIPILHPGWSPRRRSRRSRT